MDIKDIVLIILVIIVLYLIYKTKNLENLSADLPNIETFETAVETGINNKYNIDIDAMRNLSQIAHRIFKINESFTIPANTTYFNNVVINGSISGVNKDRLLIDILPKYMVIQWPYSDNIPLGWVLCDGNRYKLDASGKAILDIEGVLTPDLRGRFILGSGIGGVDENNINLTERIFNNKGGYEKHELTLEQIPAHGHNLHIFGDYAGWPAISGAYTIKLTDRQVHWYQSELNKSMRDSNTDRLPVEIKKTGGVIKPNTGTRRDGATQDYPVAAEFTTIPHNNMPPFMVLNYIMKL